ncbi:MAG: UDP-N-acetylmuramoyl-tripeptide--D-alanyl-D-alanine ligase [Bacteroidia bacterium]|jgi:UDP-N-acetylmuramoyl-tripeptide--D-alanyl-D-alanine ligase
MDLLLDTQVMINAAQYTVLYNLECLSVIRYCLFDFFCNNNHNMKVTDFYSIFIAQNQSFTSDTRTLKNGDIFFALKGDNYNGNLYAVQALADGASYAVVDEDTGSKSEQIIRVDDVLAYMQTLASYHRKQFEIPIIAIAGSNGKTTTKELLVGILSHQFKVHATKGNFNNHIGVPLTLLAMPRDTEIGLIEIGTNNFGEIKFLSEILDPNYGIITNIGKEHLEGFGDLEGVAREESELYHYLQDHNGFAFVNADDVYLKRMSHRLPNKLTFGIENEEADISVDLIEVAPELELWHQGTCIHAHLSGKHNAQNVAAAVAIATYLKVPSKDIQIGVLGYRPANNRSEYRIIGSNHFLLDAYNANPTSMMAALETFKAVKSDEKVILLGDMFEIGQKAKEEHQQILEEALKQGCPIMVAGKQFGVAAENTDAQSFSTTENLVQHLDQQRFKNTWFLVKGSRGMTMERVLEAFIQ